jgi:transposase
MRKIRDVLREKALGHSLRQIARSLGIGRGTVSDYLRRAKVAGITWPVAESLDDHALEVALFPPPPESDTRRPLPDWAYVHKELKRKHVTLALLWQEYKEQYADGYQYSRFCELYRSWRGSLDVWMRQDHKAGEKLFVDYCGDPISMIDPATGDAIDAQLFIAVLGASGFTYAEATRTQQLPDWIDCHVHAFEYFGGVPAIVVPDQTRTAVKKPCWYDPALNVTYQEMAAHFGICVIPARPRRPKDKAKVEQGVLSAERWIIAALRDRSLVGIQMVNEAIWELLKGLNDRPFRKLEATRQELFLDIDRPALNPLPQRRYEFAQWKLGVRVNMDYHVEFEKHYYSVPYRYARKEVDVRATAKIVEIFLNHNRIASHPRSFKPHRHTTSKDHMPHSHREHLEWTPSRIVTWAKKIGPSTAQLVETIMNERPHPEQGFRACLGIIRLEKRFSGERLEKACLRALRCRTHSYRSVESILKNNLEDKPLPQRAAKALPPHGNVRGNQYYA